MSTEARLNACVKELVEEALDIAYDDPAFRLASFDEFERVMYPDEDTRHRHDLDRENFGDALREAHSRFRLLQQ